MLTRCNQCNKTSEKPMKQCSRCRLATYCTKECQATAWKAHKLHCEEHPQNDPEYRAGLDRPEIKVEKYLNRWLDLWVDCFRSWSVMSLDIGNHPPNRVVTHCMQLIIHQRTFKHGNDLRRFQVDDASVVPASSIQAKYPTLLTNIDPTDFKCVRFVVILNHPEGDMWRTRVLEWKDHTVTLCRQVLTRSKERSTSQMVGWVNAVKEATETKEPSEVSTLLKRQRGIATMA
ncbi:hypothetical protein FPV67DRAFT_381088 [Lyophyllum atratum]|nr:hypothetical protein FPV67DRAFT_381088 [Lyophyllum atratum]